MTSIIEASYDINPPNTIESLRSVVRVTIDSHRIECLGIISSLLTSNVG